MLKIFRNHRKSEERVSCNSPSLLSSLPLLNSSRYHYPLKHCFPWRRAALHGRELPACSPHCLPPGRAAHDAGSAWWILTDCFSCWPRTPWLAGAASGFIMKKHMLNWIYTSCTNLSRWQVTLYSMKLKEKGGRKKKEGGGKTRLQLKVSLLVSLKTLHTCRQKRNPDHSVRLHFHHTETLTLGGSDKAEGTSPGLQASERTRSFLRLKNKRQKKRGKKS